MYALLDLAFLATIFCLDEWVLGTRIWRRRSTWQLFAGLFVATFIFDTFLTALPVVTYDAPKLLGWYLGSIPIEDLAYSLAFVILIPMTWEALGRGKNS